MRQLLGGAITKEMDVLVIAREKENANVFAVNEHFLSKITKLCLLSIVGFITSYIFLKKNQEDHMYFRK